MVVHCFFQNVRLNFPYHLIKRKLMINNNVYIRVLYRLEQNIGDAACMLHNNILYSTLTYRMTPGVSILAPNLDRLFFFNYIFTRTVNAHIRICARIIRCII